MRRINAYCYIPVFVIKHRQKYDCINKCRIMLGKLYLQIISIAIVFFSYIVLSVRISIFIPQRSPRTYDIQTKSFRDRNTILSFTFINCINTIKDPSKLLVLIILPNCLVCGVEEVGRVFYCWYLVLK